MLVKHWKSIGCLVFLMVLSSCQLTSSNDQLRGRVTIWHSWAPEETVILDQALTEFEEIYPNVNISSIAFPYDQILAEFMQAGKEGLGPTLIFGTNSWIGDLVDAGLIRPLPAELAELELFNARNLALTEYRGRQYGLPLALAPRALYYNKSLVSEPPETLDDLLQEAEAGRSVAFVPRFTEAYWGIQAFGEGLFDDQVRFTLAESGFSEWLAWLDEAQGAPGVILNVDDQSLLDLFTSGQVAYYVARPDAQALIAAEMDEERRFEIGIAPLPGRPDAPGGPLLPAEVIMLYRFNSPEEMTIVNELAAYLVNQQQSIRFLRDLDRVPANPSVRVDRRIYPNVYGFAQQSRTAVVIPNQILVDPLVEAGNRAYINVLSGAMEPAEAVCNFGREVAEFQGYTATDISLPEGCKPVDGD
jgi:arabinogalactan oligomer/maltooligosaccharide transport system substrate-binding protein